MKLRNNKGITLIALVITIIVLLILAGVALNTIAGENGILAKAKQAKEQTDASRNKEEMQLGLGGAYINKWTSENGEQEYNDFLQELVNENITIKGLIRIEYNEETDEGKNYLIVEQENQLYTTTYNPYEQNSMEKMLNNMKSVEKSELKIDYEVFYDIWFNNREYIWDGVVIDEEWDLYTVLVTYNSQTYLYKEEYNEEKQTLTTTLESITIAKPDNIVSISNGLNAVYGIDTEGNVWDLRVIPQNINEKYNLQDVTFTKISAGDNGVLMLDSSRKNVGIWRKLFW